MKKDHQNSKTTLSPLGRGDQSSPLKNSKARNKYANVPSKISSGATKPPVPNFAANRMKRQVEQEKADRLAPT